MKESMQGLNRRSFLQSGLAAGAALGAMSGTATAAIDPKSVLNYNEKMKYRVMGSSGLPVSVISLGGLVSDVPTLHYGIDQGVNLVHISTSYLGGESIKTLGEVMKTRRDQVYIALKDNFLRDDLSAIDEVLKTLNTDYVDFFMFNRHDPKSASDPKIQETFEALKKMGKVRHCGLTTHGEVKETTAAGIDSGMYSLVMPVLNQPALESLQTELQSAQNKNIGVMAMKTMKGLEKDDKAEELKLQIAYLKKILANPAVTTVLKGIGSIEMFDAYQTAVNETLTSQEDRALYRFAQSNRANNCMMCDECGRVCPQGVRVSTVLRCNDYYYGQEGDYRTAYETYQELASNQRGGSACYDCAQCEEICPNGIKIVDRLASAERLFV
ncbi:MAG: hypothetical protein GC154_05190 [bacterium]|nr:hypothetical protein [bacterium]